jgi:O-antigen/teichoic acid export membrane protein
MSKVRTYARNLAANWIGYAANLVVMFFLSPFVVHSLGDEAYGVWSLIMSLTGYLGLVELGVRFSTGRYINYYLGRQEPEHVARVVNTSLAFYTGVSLLVFGIALVLGLSFGSIFAKVPRDLAAQAPSVLLLLATNVWISFFSATFSQLLDARDRFDLRNVCDVIALAIRTGGTVAVLLAGGGLVPLAGVQVVSGLAGCGLVLVLARWKGVRVQIGWRHVRYNTLKELFRFGGWAFFGNVSLRIIYYADAAVIGLLLGVSEITFYSIGWMLVDYGRNLLNQAYWTFVPEVQKAGGRANLADMRWLLLKTTRVMMCFAVLLFVGFMVFGQEFILLWMGSDYRISGHIVLILAIPNLVAIASLASRGVLNSLGHVKVVAAICSVEALCHVLMSVALVLLLNLGIYAVAFGAIVPMIICSGLLMPLFACRRTEMRFLAFAKETSLRWLAATIVFGAVCVAILRLAPVAGWGCFALKVLVACALYLPVGWFVVLRKEDRPDLGITGWLRLSGIAAGTKRK